LNNSVGEPSKVLDCIINPKIGQIAKKDQSLLGFLAELLVNYISEKHKLVMEEGFTFLCRIYDS